MNLSEARNIIQQLASGFSPLTGEQLPADHLVNQGDCVRALALAVEVMARAETALRPPRPGDENAGKPWGAADDEELRRMHLEGSDVTSLRHHFKRSRGAIVSRLQRLGLVAA